jgi:hypothetical protein
MNDSLPARLTGTVIAASISVVALRITVGLRDVASLGVEPGNEAALRVALGVMGLGYLACGLVAFWRARSTASALFTLHGICQAIHWGGPVRVSSDTFQLAIWFLYFTISMLGISALLHFTLLFPQRWSIASRKSTRLFLYLPVVLAAVLAASRIMLPSSIPAGDALQSSFFILETVQVNLYDLLAIIVIAVRFGRATGQERRTCGLGVMLAGAVVGPLPYLVAILIQSFVPAITIPGGLGSQPYTLFFILTPLAFTYAILTKMRSSRETRR